MVDTRLVEHILSTEARLTHIENTLSELVETTSALLAAMQETLEQENEQGLTHEKKETKL